MCPKIDNPDYESADARNGSAELANQLIDGAAECVTAIIEDNDVPYTVKDNPILVAAHAMVQLLDYELGRIVQILERGCVALEQIAESVDFIAARPETLDIPTEQERMVIYRALEERYLKRSKRSGQPMNIEEMDAALLRFKAIAGL